MAAARTSFWDIWVYGELGSNKRPGGGTFAQAHCAPLRSRGHTARGKGC